LLIASAVTPEEAMMIQEWKIGNFKSIVDTTNLKLAPLTVLVGANSSGKSTVLQSILATMQTATSPTPTSPFALNGKYVKLGAITDVLHQGKETDPLEFGFSLEISPGSLTNAIPASQSIRPLSSRGFTVRVDVRCVLANPHKAEAPQLVLESAWMGAGTSGLGIKRNSQSKAADADANPAMHDQYHIFDLEYPVIQNRPLASKADLRVQVDHFLPASLWEPYDADVELLRSTLSLCERFLPLRQEVPDWVFDALAQIPFETRTGREFRTVLQNITRQSTRRAADMQSLDLIWQGVQSSVTVGDWFRKINQQASDATRLKLARDIRSERDLALDRLGRDRNPHREPSYRSRQLPDPLGTVRTAIIDYLVKRIWYLGPLRDNPKAIYELPPVPEETDVGTRGEFTAAVLQYHHADIVICPLPGPELRPVELSLGEAVGRWLDHMGLIEKITTRDRGKIGTELALHLPQVERTLDLTNVGVGVSQLLPSVVMGLLSSPGSTLLMEQPELHLHPKVQSILADFLIGLAKTGRQCIVETHSEYLVNRLRRRIAESTGDSVQKLVQIYFVERVDGGSTFRPIVTNEYGAIPDWPKGFFDEGPDEAQSIIQAAAKKRQARLDSITPLRRGK
jgi:predicted ATPase